MRKRAADDSRRAGDEAIARIRAAIVELDARRREALADAGSVLVNQVRADHVVREHAARLSADRAQVISAMSAAERAADAARAAGETDAALYDQAAGGFRNQLGVLDDTLAQLGALRTDAADTAQRARALIRESHRSLDAALHEQLGLLLAAESARRRATIAAYRASRADRGANGPA